MMRTKDNKDKNFKEGKMDKDERESASTRQLSDAIPVGTKIKLSF